MKKNKKEIITKANKTMSKSLQSLQKFGEIKVDHSAYGKKVQLKTILLDIVKDLITDPFISYEDSFFYEIYLAIALNGYLDVKKVYIEDCDEWDIYFDEKKVKKMVLEFVKCLY